MYATVCKQSASDQGAGTSVKSPLLEHAGSRAVSGRLLRLGALSAAAVGVAGDPPDLGHRVIERVQPFVSPWDRVLVRAIGRAGGVADPHFHVRPQVVTTFKA